MLVDSKTQMVFGVSKGCYYEFGIRPDIVAGKTHSSNVLYLTDIFPEVTFKRDDKGILVSGSSGSQRIDKKLKSPVLDTTKLPSQFYVDKSDFVRIGQPNEGALAFRKYKIKYEVFPSESFGLDVSLCLIAFTLDEGQNLKRMPSNVQNYLIANKFKKKKTVVDRDSGHGDEMEYMLPKKEKKKKDKYEDDGNMMRRWKKDQETNTADRERKIKERKLMLSEKRVPKIIKILRFSLIFVFFLILIINASELITNIRSGQRSLVFLGEKESGVVDVGYRIRILDLLAK